MSYPSTGASYPPPPSGASAYPASAPGGPVGGYPPPTGPSAAPPPKPKGHTGALLGIVAVIAVVAAVLLLNLAGVVHLPFLPGGSSSPSGPGPAALTYHQAENIANTTADTRGGGTWQVVAAESFQSYQTVNPANSQAPCQLLGFAPGDALLLGTGTAYAWGLVYVTTPMAAYSHQLYIIVQNGTGSVVTQIDPPSTCPGVSIPGGAGPLPANFSNSPEAAAVAQRTGGAAFLSVNPSASIFMVAGDYSWAWNSFAFAWIVQYYGACTAVGLGTGTLPTFGATIFSSNLTVAREGWTNYSCTSTSATGSSQVTFSPAGSGHSGGSTLYFDNLTLSATGGLTTANFGLAIFQSNRTLVGDTNMPTACYIPPYTNCGGPPVSGGWYAVLRQGGSIVAAYPNTPANIAWNSQGGPTPISSAVTLELISTAPLSGSGYQLVTFSWSWSVAGGMTL